MKVDESFGIIPITPKKKKWEVLLVLHKNGNFWGFPKGHADLHEKGVDAAIRELKEETNLEAFHFIQLQTLEDRYEFSKDEEMVSKTVYYYIAEVRGTLVLQKHEILDAKWCTFQDAKNLATYDGTKVLIDKAEKILNAKQW